MRHRATGLLACIALLAPAVATANSVDYGATAIGGGLYRYELTIDNSLGFVPAAGLSVLEAGSAFDPSNIAAPGGWDYFPPEPDFGIDALDYFSLDPTTDVPTGGSLGGFGFDSATSPAALGAGPAVEVLGDDGLTNFLGRAGFGPHGLAVLAFGTAVGGGLFEYELVINNFAGLTGVAGLSILDANSLLGLGPDSTIVAASGWDYFPPEPDFGIDALDFFSLDFGSDAAVGGSLGGFFIRTAVDPTTFFELGVRVELLGAEGQTVYRGLATIPEPSSVLMTAMALGGLGAVAVARSRRLSRRHRESA